MVAGATLRLLDLASPGSLNAYYAATVKSMTTSLAAFVFGSFDPALFVSVDKPAPGLWPQALLAKVIGFGDLAVLLPQALAGIASIMVLTLIVRHTHGDRSGFVAGLALAVAPVAVAVDRNNTMDAELVLVLLVAAWCTLRSLDGRVSLFLLAGALIGLGFEIKMSQALLAMPALAIAYLLAAARRPLARIVHTLGFCAVAVAVSLLWIVFVDLTPEAERPYVGSSANNSALELALGHNGLERLPQELLFLRRAPRPAGAPPVGVPPPQNVGSAPAPPGPNDEAGDRGALRLFNAQLGGQVSWYIPLALVGAVAALARAGRRRPISSAQASVVLWLVWLVPAAALFSWSGIFHRYYLVMLAPPLAALTGVGAVAVFSLARERVVWRAVAVATAGAAAAVGMLIASRSAWFAPWLTPVLIAGALAWWAAISLTGPRAGVPALVALLCFMAGPAAWASTTLDAADGGFPFAGPELLRRGVPSGTQPVPPGARPAGAQPPSALLAFLLSEHRDERFILATASTQTAAPLMLRTDRAVMAIGGFSGGDAIVTVGSFEAMVREGVVRFVAIEQRMDPQLVAWLRVRCVEVPPSRAGSLGGPSLPDGRPPALADCGRVRSGLP